MMLTGDCTAIAQLILGELKFNDPRHVSGDELKLCAQVNDRQIRAAISELRRHGQLIVGNWNGYYLARSPEEVYATVGELRRQVQNILAVADAMMEAAKSL